MGDVEGFVVVEVVFYCGGDFVDGLFMVFYGG